jgi:hypothetical protein
MASFNSASQLETHAMDHVIRNRSERHAARQQDLVLYRLSYAGGFVVFLTCAAICRLLPRDMNPFTRGHNDASSIIGDARRATAATIPYAFMG